MVKPFKIEGSNVTAANKEENKFRCSKSLVTDFCKGYFFFIIKARLCLFAETYPVKDVEVFFVSFVNFEMPLYQKKKLPLN